MSDNLYISAHDLLRRAQDAFGLPVRKVSHWPDTWFLWNHLDVPGDADDKESWISQKLQLEEGLLRTLLARYFLRFEVVRPGETTYLPSPRGWFWAQALQQDLHSTSPIHSATTTPVVHFYGYKGGQGRSTALALLARTLAEDGWRVLAVDVDAEAPSLPALFGVQLKEPEATLVGLRAGLTPQPARVLTPADRNGRVDILGMCPAGADFLLDLASFVAEGTIYPLAQTKVIRAVAAAAEQYDVLLVDHRTGMNSTVLPWMNTLPGALALFVRPDGQWQHVGPLLATIWGQVRDFARVLVTPAPAVDISENDWKREHQLQVEEMLTTVTRFESQSYADDLPEVGPGELTESWVVWPYDLRLSGGGSQDDAGPAIGRSIAAVRGLMDLSGHKRPDEDGVLYPTQTHPSGAQDEGYLIQTEAFRKLSNANSTVNFILGRKGTGKTRLVRALSEIRDEKGRPLGEPLLVPKDFPFASLGTRAGNGVVRVFEESSSEDKEDRFWWALLLLFTDQSLPIGEEGEELRADRLRNLVSLRPSELASRCREQVAQAPERRIALIDGIETAFRRDFTHRMVAALLRVMDEVDVDSVLRSKLVLRVFLRTDLAERGYENFEQRVKGRRLDLIWDEQSILNFALSRLHTLSWLVQNFPDVVNRLQRPKMRETLERGALSVDECQEVLLSLFPIRLRKMNMNAVTFFKVWFSDDADAGGGFYPRIYDDFLRKLNDLGMENGPKPAVVDNKISQDVIYRAHDHAARLFLDQVRQELISMVDLTEESLMQLLQEMRGGVTPFDPTEWGRELASKTRPKLSEDQVRDTLHSMRRIGIFEYRKGPGAVEWRCGRLFKAALGMKYRRTPVPSSDVE